MRILEIKTQKNGSHSNHDFHGVVPNGWAVIPNDLETPNFPFGEVTAEEIDGVMTVTKWVAGTMPEYEEPEKSVTAIEQLRADIDYLALMSEVEL